MREIPIDQMSRERLEAELQSAWNTIKLQQHWLAASVQKACITSWITRKIDKLPENTTGEYVRLLLSLQEFITKHTERDNKWPEECAGNVSDNLPEHTVVRDTIGTRQPEMLYKAGE